MPDWVTIANVIGVLAVLKALSLTVAKTFDLLGKDEHGDYARTVFGKLDKFKDWLANK